MREKKNIYRVIGVLLIAILTVGGFATFFHSERSDPPNPITAHASELKAEVLEGKSGLDLEEQTDEGKGSSSESEEQKEEKKEEQKKEEQKKEEKKEEQKKEEQEQQEEEQEQQEEEQEQQEQQEQPEEPDTPEQPEQPDEGAEEQPDQPPSDQPADAGDGGESEDQPSVPGGENQPGDGGEEDGPATPGDSGGTDGAGLVTDLTSRIITFSELEDDTLNFYAYYSDIRVKSDIVVKYRHEKDTGNGTVLEGRGRDYSTKLSLGKNEIIIYYTDGDGNRNYSSFVISYEATKADENTPTQGQNPPTITTNLDNWEGEVKTQSFTFTVKARTWENKQIYYDHIVVMMDGKEILNPTGNSTYEYVLYFTKPNRGDTSNHKITVLAWDDDGNSRLEKYELVYRSIDEGDVIGQVRVVVDATTVGKGIIADEVVDIVQGRPASYTVLEALDVMNMEYDYAGTKDNGFYLRNLRRGGAFRNARMPEALEELIARDGLEFRDPCTKNQLGEFDFTQGSGWMYCVNSGAYSGKGLSEWHLNDGDTIYLRFTLAYGKDIGVTDSGFGRLESYCGLWIDEGFIPLEHDYKTERKDPTETEDGYIKETCKKCEHEEMEILPALGTTEPEVPPADEPENKPSDEPEIPPADVPPANSEDDPAGESADKPEDEDDAPAEQSQENENEGATE